MLKELGGAAGSTPPASELVMRGSMRPPGGGWVRMGEGRAVLWDRWVLSYCGARPLIFRELCFPRKVNTSRLLSLISTPSIPPTPPSPPAAAPGDLQPRRGREGERGGEGVLGGGGQEEVGRRGEIETEMMEVRDSDNRRRRRSDGDRGEKEEEKR